MRLDKFLKVSRIIKRRTVAKEIADKGRIMINDKPAKSSSDVRVGDTLVTLTVRADDLVETTKKNDAAGMYTVLKEDYKETF